MSKAEHDAITKWYEDLENRWLKHVLWGVPYEVTPHKYEDDLKWAYVVVDGKRTMLWVNNKDMKAYKSKGYEIKQPLEEVKYDSFERWCRLMDL